MELGTVYARLGSEVVVMEAADRILPGMDRDFAEPVQEAATELFDEIVTGTLVEAVSVSDDGVTVATKGAGGERRFDRVLVAIGRRPSSDELGLETLEVETDADGFIVVDEQRRTSAEGVFAAGDVTGGMGLAHEAMSEGKVAADVIAGQPAAYDVRAVPAVVYTHPQIAFCGLDESAAQAETTDVRIGRFPLRASGRALTMGGHADRGLVKLVCGPGGRILGGGIVGPHAESLIAEVALAIEMGATVRDVAQTVHPHPTLSECVSEAAESLLGQPTHFVARR